MFVNNNPRPFMPYEVTYDDETDVTMAESCFFLLLKELNLNTNLSMSLRDYISALFFLAFDLSIDHSSGLRSLYRSNIGESSVTCKLKFAEALEETMIMLVISEHQAIMHYNALKNVSLFF